MIEIWSVVFIFLHQTWFMETIDRLELIQHSLKVLRAIMLVLSVVLLLISVINSNAVFLEALMIAAFSVILYIGKELSPVSYRLFILILTISLIYNSGNILQTIFSPKPFTAVYIGIKGYTILVHILFIAILWRHYQYWQVTQQLEFEAA